MILTKPFVEDVINCLILEIWVQSFILLPCFKTRSHLMTLIYDSFRFAYRNNVLKNFDHGVTIFFFYKKRICTGPEMIPTTNDPQFRVGDHFGGCKYAVSVTCPLGQIREPPTGEGG